jgi:hypothetical protein
MIAISQPLKNQIVDAPPRNGSLRRIDDILAELLAGYAEIKPVALNDPGSAPAGTVALPEPVIGTLISLPAEVAGCCAPAAD